MQRPLKQILEIVPPIDQFMHKNHFLFHLPIDEIIKERTEKFTNQNLINVIKFKKLDENEDDSLDKKEPFYVRFRSVNESHFESKKRVKSQKYK